MAKQPLSYEKLGLLWKEYFRDRSLWYDNGGRKHRSNSPDFRHKITDDSLWLGGSHALCWVYEELRRCTVRPSEFPELQRNIERSKDTFTIVTLLKTYAKKKDLSNGISLHTDILRRGLLERSPHIASSLIHMYAKCGMLAKAQKMLNELPVEDVISWSALISGYVSHGKYKEAVILFHEMQKRGISPNAITFTCILKAYGNIGALSEGKRIHEEVVSKGLLENDIVLGTALVNMYIKCGKLTKARQVHEELPARDVVSWSALIAGYVQHGRCHEALQCFESMNNEGFSPDAVTFVFILQACGISKAINKGKEFHKDIMNNALFKNNVMVGNALVDMYVKCCVLEKARDMLDEVSVRNEVTWNTLISGYADKGQCIDAINCLMEMQIEGFSPDAITFLLILKACSNAGAIDQGVQVHKEIVSRGIIDVVLGTALVDMYVKCGFLTKAQRVLEELPVRDVVSWNVLIAGYAQHGEYNEAMNSFQQMQSEGIPPDEGIFSCILKACSYVCAIEKGEEIHGEIRTQGLARSDIVLGCALVDMYTKCGNLVKAQKLHDELPARNIVTWSALIAGYSQHGKFHEALDCFDRMRSEDLHADAVIFICILKACGITGSLERGCRIHEDIVTKGLLEENIVLGNALVDMYAKCGALAKSLELIDTLPVRDIVAWSSLITGYAQKGQAENALMCFHCLQYEGLSPNEVTLLCVLTACCRSGLLEEARILLGNTMQKYNIRPGLEHYTCMVVALGCAGQFDKILSIVESMPWSDCRILSFSVLDLCKKWSNVKFGRFIFSQVLQENDK